MTFSKKSLSFHARESFEVCLTHRWGSTVARAKRNCFVREKGKAWQLEKFYRQLQNYIAKSNSTAGTEEIFSRVPCIMDGLKRLAKNCSPATDAVYRCSLETSSHCLVAVGVIASLLVGPGKRRRKRDTKWVFLSLFQLHDTLKYQTRRKVTSIRHYIHYAIQCCWWAMKRLLDILRDER